MDTRTLAAGFRQQLARRGAPGLGASLLTDAERDRLRRAVRVRHRVTRGVVAVQERLSLAILEAAAAAQDGA